MTGIRSQLLVALAVLALGLAMAPAEAAMFGVNARADDASTILAAGDVAGAPGYEQANWNNVGSVGASSLVLTDETGSSAAGVTVSYGGDFYGGTTGWGSATADDVLMNGGHRFHGSTSIVFANLIPGDIYDIVFYWGFGDGRSQTVTAIDSSGSTPVVMTTTSTRNAWVEATGANSYTGNYFVFADQVVTDNGTLSVALSNGTNRQSFSGIQIIPEPATIALLGLGGLGALLRRRR